MVVLEGEDFTEGISCKQPLRLNVTTARGRRMTRIANSLIALITLVTLLVAWITMGLRGEGVGMGLVWRV